jgi:DNA-binding response OmpR family regulator
MTVGDADKAEAGPILVVDDEQTARTVFVRTLEEAGYWTVEAEDGVSALVAAARDRPSLILLDITMPRLNGVEVVKAIRAGGSGSTTPIILVTALAQVEDRVRGLEAGADDYLAKPVALDELVARVGAHLRARRAWAAGHDVGSGTAADRERSRLVQMSATESLLDAGLRTAADEKSVFRLTTSLLASVRGVVMASVALREPAGLLVVHSVHGDPTRLTAGAVEGSVAPVPAPVAWALETGDLFVHTVDESDRSADAPWSVPGAAVASQAVIPISAGGFTIGVLTLEADRPDFFGDPEIKLIERAARMVAQRLGEIERRGRESALTAVLEVERSETKRFADLTATVDDALHAIFRVDHLLRAACRLPVDLRLCRFAWLGLVQADKSGPRLHPVTFAGDGEGFLELIVQIRSMPSAFVGESSLAADRTSIVNDLLCDSRFHRCHDAMGAAGLRSMVFVPIFDGLRPAAGLAFYGTEVEAFGDREVALLERLAANVGQRLAAIDSVRRLPRSHEGIRKLARRADGGSVNGAGTS